MDAWTDEHPLYIWSEVKADLAPIRAAKAQLEHDGAENVPVRVVPIGVGRDGFVNGHLVSGRVLAIGSRPPFLCDYALVSERTSSEGWIRAFCWVTGMAERDSKATLIEDIIIAQFGPGTREITADELEGERLALAYQTGTE